MPEEAKRGVLQPTTGEAIAEARKILVAARHGALATLATDGGHPMASRVGVATLDGRTPLLLVSTLAAHTAALAADPRCSLLVGEVQKGDPLASARVTLRCWAERIERGSEPHETARKTYLDAHPKAQLYVDLGDFGFMALRVEAVTFIGGFGRAYAIAAEEWMAPSE